MSEGASEGSGGTADRVAASLRVGDPMARAVVRAALFGGEWPSIGRYAIVRRIGSGGMGVVYEACDAELDRRIALKMLAEVTDPRLHERLPREARALARLSNPNVVQVYDVGLQGGRFFIAMELVEGSTLRVWQHGRSISEIIATYSAAGRGVAAAHAVGLLHRDLKPDNVLMGSDGRPRVVDFGLAGDWVPARETTGDDDPRPGTTVPPASARMGTPGYIAPEQLDGEPADVRSDIFAFCVALFEALAGVHPFLARTPARTDETGDVDWSLLPKATPRSVRAALARGLAPAPALRFASMDELLQALDRPPRRFALAAAAVVGTSLAAALVLARSEPTRATPCDRLELAAPWDDGSADRLADAFARAQPGFGASLWSAVEGRVADWAAAWGSTRARMCDGTLAATAMEVGVPCLASARARFVTLIDLFEAADSGAVLRAATLIERLPSAGECLALADAPVTSPRPRDPTARALDERILRMQTELGAGRFAEDISAIEAVVADAEASNDAAVKVHAWSLHADALRSADHVLRATRLSEAYFAAVEAGLGPEAADAALGLAESLGVNRRDFASGNEWLAHAEGAIARFGLDDSYTDRVARQRALFLLVGERVTEAEVALRALVARCDARDDEGLLRANLASDLGNLMLSAGRAQDAEAAFTDAYERMVRLVGPEHPSTVPAMIGRASAMGTQARNDEAEALLLRAAAVVEGARPQHTVNLVIIYNNLSVTLEDARPEQALEYARKALRVAEGSSADAAIVSEIHHAIGNIARQLGDLDEAQLHFERERALIEGELGVDHPDVGHPLHSLGRIHLARGELAVAEPMLRRALELWTAAYGPDHPLVAFPSSSLGELLVADDRPTEAIEPLRRALALRLANPGDPAKLAQTRFALGTALWSDRRTRSEARQLAIAARDAYAALGAGQASQRDAVDVWLKAHAR